MGALAVMFALSCSTLHVFIHEDSIGRLLTGQTGDSGKADREIW